jgi:hypothetical protein
MVASQQTGAAWELFGMNRRTFIVAALGSTASACLPDPVLAIITPVNPQDVLNFTVGAYWRGPSVVLSGSQQSLGSVTVTAVDKEAGTFTVEYADDPEELVFV